MSDEKPEQVPDEDQVAEPTAEQAAALEEAVRLGEEAQKALDIEAGDEEAGEEASEDEDQGEDGDGEPAPSTYEELEVEVAALKDQLLRALAEVENTRRRADRDKADASKYAIANFAREVLDIADNLHRALDSVSDDARAESEAVENLYVGIENTEKKLPAVLEKFGVKPIEAMGKQFDHNFHQAMFELDDPEIPAGTVVQELQRGYTIADRLLRPAMVGVAKGGPKKEAPAAGEAEQVDAPKEAPSDPSEAYEKQAEAADAEADTSGPKVDTEL